MARTALLDIPELLSPDAQRLAAIEKYGSVIEPVEPTLTDRIRNFVYDATMRFGGDRGDALRRAGMAEDVIGVTPLQGFSDYQLAKRAYSEGDKTSGDINMAMAATSLLPGNERPVVSKLREVVTDPAFGPVIQTARAGEQFEIPVMNPVNAKGYYENPLMGAVDLKTRPDEISPSTYKRRVENYLTNPDIQNMENARLLGGRITSPEDTFLQSATYENLVGYPLIPLPADMTTRGIVDRVAGIDIEPYLVEGGPRHMDKWKNWMSMSSAAKAKQAHANRVRDETGKDPIYVYMGMADEGSNFSESTSAVALSYIDAMGGLTEKGRKILDTKMRSWPDVKDKKGIAESWPGYEDPEQIFEWLTNDEKGPTSGNRRKAFSEALAQKGLYGEGAPIMSDVYSIINDPELRGSPAGMSGYRAMVAGDVDPLSMERNYDMNQSYDTIITGKQSLALTEPRLPYDLMFYDMAQAKSNMKSPYRSVQISGGGQDYQMADENWLNRINSYKTKLRELIED